MEKNKVRKNYTSQSFLSVFSYNISVRLRPLARLIASEELLTCSLDGGINGYILSSYYNSDS